jgi:hypothetical protein
MKSKINSPDESCFNFPSGYSIDMSGNANIPFGTASFLFGGSNNWRSANSWWNNFQSGSLNILTSSFYN